MRTATLAVLAAMACVAVSVGGRADPSDDPIGGAGSQLRLVYDASDECPDRDAFVREWLEVAGPNGFSAAELEEGVLRVTLRRSGAEFAAHVVMVDGMGQCAAQRNLSAPSCAELAADVAASVDLAIRDWTCLPPTVRECPTPHPVPVCPPAPISDTVGPTSEPRRGELGGAVGLVWFVPEQGRGAWGHALVLGYHSERSLWGAKAGPAWGGQLQVGYWAPEVLPAQVPGSDLGLGLRLVSARLSVCPVELRVVGPLGVPLCGTMEAGLVDVRLGEQRLPMLFWGALGIAPRLRLSTDTLFAEAETSIAFPTMRYRIEGGREVMNWISPGAQVHMGVRF